MTMQTIASIFISKVKTKNVTVKLFQVQVENFSHQNDSKFTLKSI